MQRYIVAKFAPVPLNTHKQVGSMTTIQQLSTIDQTMFAQKVRRMFVFQRLKKWRYWLGSDEIEKKTTLEEHICHILHMHSVCSLILAKKCFHINFCRFDLKHGPLPVPFHLTPFNQLSGLTVPATQQVLAMQ